MNINIITWMALAASAIVCLAIAYRHSLAIKWLADILPIKLGQSAKVADSREFSASTVATSISLATVIVAFYELAPFLGIWLLWPAITTALGLAAFSLVAKRVWRKMALYEYRPTLHAYLGEEYRSKRLALTASIFTAIGYLTAFAVELTVGSRFLSPLLPGVPIFLLISLMAIVSFAYTGLGGFRTVVVTDRLQMAFIWGLIIAIALYYFGSLSNSGFAAGIDRIPHDLIKISWNDDKLPFLLGIFVMNLLTYIGNMSLWQRIAGAQSEDTVSKGLWGSVWSAAFSWSLLALAAVGALAVVVPIKGENMLITVVKSMYTSPVGGILIFVVIMGLLGAMLSTASTQLMAVTHTVYEDLIAPFRKTDLNERMHTKREVWYSRSILALSAVCSVGIVEILTSLGFSVADMAFAVYGAALGLVPPILATLFLGRQRTQKMGSYAMFAISMGFIACWGAAAYGRVHGQGNLVFLSPIISAGIAAVTMLVGYFATSSKSVSEAP